MILFNKNKLIDDFIFSRDIEKNKMLQNLQNQNMYSHQQQFMNPFDQKY